MIVDTEVEAEDDSETVFPEWSSEPLPRKGYSPFSGEQWPATLRETTYTDKMFGGKTHKATPLYGLDAYGRAVYLDTTNRKGRFLYVVPKHHRLFDAPMDATPLTEFPPKHGPSRDKKLNAPDGDVLAVVDQSEKMDTTDWGMRFEKELVGRAITEEWLYLSPTAVDVLTRVIERRDTPGRTSTFPYTNTEKLIEKIGDTDD